METQDFLFPNHASCPVFHSSHPGKDRTFTHYFILGLTLPSEIERQDEVTSEGWRDCNES